MAHTPAPAPDDASLWRRALARAHPDAGGQHDLFIWLGSVRDHVLGSLPGEVGKPSETTDRIPYDPDLGYIDEFVTLTARALSVGKHAEEPFREVLGKLIDCPAHTHGRAASKQERGASFKQLAYIAHLSGFSGEERLRWYELARSIPLSEAHAGHLIARLKQEREAAA